MASRRILKKNIHCLLHEVAMEAYIGSFFMKDFDEGKFCDFLKQVYELDSEFVSRANHPSGKDDSKLIKAYYKNLIEDFNMKVTEVIENWKNKK